MQNVHKQSRIYPNAAPLVLCHMPMAKCKNMNHDSTHAVESSCKAWETMIRIAVIADSYIHYLLVLVARNHLDDAAALVHHRHLGPVAKMCSNHVIWQMLYVLYPWERLKSLNTPKSFSFNVSTHESKIHRLFTVRFNMQIEVTQTPYSHH